MKKLSVHSRVIFCPHYQYMKAEENQSFPVRKKVCYCCQLWYVLVGGELHSKRFLLGSFLTIWFFVIVCVRFEKLTRVYKMNHYTIRQDGDGPFFVSFCVLQAFLVVHGIAVFLISLLCIIFFVVYWNRAKRMTRYYGWLLPRGLRRTSYDMRLRVVD